MFLVYLLFLHLLADFILQPREMGKKKSDNVVWLAGHVLIQYLVFQLGLIVAHYYGFLPVKNDYDARLMINGLALGNAVIHGLVDSITWKLYKLSVVLRHPKHLFERIEPNNPAIKAAFKFKFWEDHFFYLTIGLDQFLHISTIVLLLEFISKRVM